MSRIEDRRNKRRRVFVLAGAFLALAVALPMAWFGFATYGYYTQIASGEGLTLEDVRIQSSIADVVANTDVTANDLKQLKPSGMAPELGSRSARLTIVAFIDYGCPFCAENAHTMRRVMTDFDDRVHLLIRDYPVTNPTGGSRKVALASNCVLEQGQEKYWRFHDLVFADQSKTSDEVLREFASVANVNTAAYEACMGEQRYDLKIDNDIDVGKRAGVEGTPTMFFNGAKVQGAMKEDVLVRLIEGYLEALPQ